MIFLRVAISLLFQLHKLTEVFLSEYEFFVVVVFVGIFFKKDSK